MAKRTRQFALLRVLAAAAWADGRLDPEETNRIKELMLAYDLGDREVAEIDRLLEIPVSYDRCEELTRELLPLLTTDAERREVLEEVERLFHADGALDPAEREVIDNLRSIMESMSTVDTFIGRIVGVFRKALPPRSPGAGELTEYVKNVVLQRLDDFSGGAWRASVDAESLNRYTLVGAVLGKVAAAEGGVGAGELDRIRQILASTYALSGEPLDWTVRAVEEVASGDLDRQALLSEFNRIADMDERKQLLNAAFAVAASDGVIAAEELEELRLISNFLWIDPRDYNAVRRRWKN
jgi:uncharacterized tellurite resistance protein B-like protein